MLLTTTLRQFYDSHPEDCTCFACNAARAAIKQLGGRCPEHSVVRAVCRCPKLAKRMTDSAAWLPDQTKPWLKSCPS